MNYFKVPGRIDFKLRVVNTTQRLSNAEGIALFPDKSNSRLKVRSTLTGRINIFAESRRSKLSNFIQRTGNTIWLKLSSQDGSLFCLKSLK